MNQIVNERLSRSVGRGCFELQLTQNVEVGRPVRDGQLVQPIRRERLSRAADRPADVAGGDVDDVVIPDERREMERIREDVGRPVRRSDEGTGQAIDAATQRPVRGRLGLCLGRLGYCRALDGRRQYDQESGVDPYRA